MRWCRLFQKKRGRSGFLLGCGLGCLFGFQLGALGLRRLLLPGLLLHLGLADLLLFNLCSDLARQSQVASLAQWFIFPRTYLPVSIKEGIAVLAQEMFAMPYFSKHFDAVLDNRIVTLGAGPTEKLLEVFFAVGEAVPLIVL